MAVRALELWHELERDAGTKLYWQTGMYDFGGNDTAKINRIEKVLETLGTSFEVMDADAMHQRHPQWHPRADWKIIFSEFAGIVYPNLTLDVLVGMARVYGATVLEHMPVTKLDLSDPNNPKVITQDAIFSARKVVVTAGAWSSKLVPLLEGGLQIQDNLTAFFRPKNLADFAPERFPVFIQRDDEQVYGFPNFGLPGIKIALHSTGDIVDPDKRQVLNSDARVSQLYTWLERYLPDAAGAYMQAKTCLYSNTHQEDFVIDFHPETKNVVVASPCSGHGFKFTPLLGEILADMILGQPNSFISPQFWVKNAARVFEKEH